MLLFYCSIRMGSIRTFQATVISRSNPKFSGELCSDNILKIKTMPNSVNILTFIECHNVESHIQGTSST